MCIVIERGPKATSTQVLLDLLILGEIGRTMYVERMHVLHTYH